LSTFPGPRVQIEARLWQNWCLESLTVHYTPAVGTTREGSLVGCVVQDPEDTQMIGEENIRWMTSVAGSAESLVYVPFTFRASKVNQKLFTEDEEGERRFFSPGRLKLAVNTDITDLSLTLGTLWITYRVKFWNASTKNVGNQGYAMYRTISATAFSITDTLSLAVGDIIKTPDSDFTLTNWSSDADTLDLSFLTFGQYCQIELYAAVSASVTSMTPTYTSVGAYIIVESISATKIYWRVIVTRTSNATAGIKVTAGSAVTWTGRILTVMKMKAIAPTLVVDRNMFTPIEEHMMRDLYKKLQRINMAEFKSKGKHCGLITDESSDEEEEVLDQPTFKIVQKRKSTSGTSTPK